jgi:hypothetical protein
MARDPGRSFRIFLTEEEHEWLRAVADHNCLTMSAYLRNTISTAWKNMGASSPGGADDGLPKVKNGPSYYIEPDFIDDDGDYE